MPHSILYFYSVDQPRSFPPYPGVWAAIRASTVRLAAHAGALNSRQLYLYLNSRKSLFWIAFSRFLLSLPSTTASLSFSPTWTCSPPHPRLVSPLPSGTVDAPSSFDFPFPFRHRQQNYINSTWCAHIPNRDSNFRSPSTLRHAFVFFQPVRDGLLSLLHSTTGM
ncbi:hypothetical protein T439DRAFT_19450 [Meredithblackwellia eburnea MCA 4105]